MMANYLRVIPRDLFNEASLLKCMGQLYLNLEKRRMEGCLHHDGEAFAIVQNEATGGLQVRNVNLIVGGCWLQLERPLNSRQPFPLWATLEGEDEETEVFDDDGSLSAPFIKLIETLQESR